jgi:hypothetical protein
MVLMGDDCSNEYVQLEASKLDSLAQSILFQGGEATEWDEHGWHYTGSTYQGDEAKRQERVALYVLALDAINFCFWPHPAQKQSNSLEYDHLAIALRTLAEQDDDSDSMEGYFFAPHNLSKLTVGEMKAALDLHLEGHLLPNIEERCRLWNEVGDALLQYFEGSAMTLIRASDKSAAKLVQLVVRTFPGFRDEAVWRGKWVALYKRAQIVVGDLDAALRLELEDMDQLTTFADYRVPQVLRHWGAIQYSTDLAQKVDSQTELNAEEELSIRAATVVCVDELVKIVNASEINNMTAVTIDWHLWQVGEQMNQQGELKPHHRVNTIFY